LIGPEEFQGVQQGFVSDLISRPTGAEGLRTLRTFQAVDPEGLNILVPKKDQQALLTYLTKRAQFESSPIYKSLQQQLSEGEKIFTLVKGTAGNVAESVRLAGGSNSQFAQAARAAIYKDILDYSQTRTTLGVKVIDANKAVKRISYWKQTGKLDSFMRPEDWNRITNYEKYAAIISEVGDVGGAFVGGNIRSVGAQAPITIWGDAKKVSQKLFRPLLANEYMAYILTMPAKEPSTIPYHPMYGIMRQQIVAMTTAERQLRRHTKGELIED